MTSTNANALHAALDSWRAFIAQAQAALDATDAAIATATTLYDLDDPANLQHAAEAALAAQRAMLPFLQAPVLKTFNTPQGIDSTVYMNLNNQGIRFTMMAKQAQEKAAADAAAAAAAARQAAANAALIAQQKAATDAETLAWKIRLGLPV